MRTDSQFVHGAYHWAQWCVRITREYDIRVGLTFLRDDFPLWYARAVDTSPRDLAYEMRDTSLRDRPRVWDATAARVSLGAARPIPIMTSRERHITRLTSLSNITTVAYTASRVRWERFRVYFCRAYKLFVETFCFVANANIITVAYTASRRVHWERFCVSFKTKSERTTCLLYNVLFYITFCYITFCSGWTLIFVVIWCYLTFWARVQKTHQYTPYKPLKWGAHY